MPTHTLAGRLAALVSGLLVACLACTAGEPVPVEPVDLAAAERSVFSQYGEDGVIERIFEVIEPGPKFAVEFGAHDGVTNSNMRNLVVNHGWSTFQIEGDPGRAAKLRQNYTAYPTTRTLEAWVWPGNIEILFDENGVPTDLDLLVIDIDTNDYYIWRAIHEFRPKVVMIEANFAFPPPSRAVIDFHPMNYWDRTYYSGASIQSLYELGRRKGYEMLYQMTAGPNLLFVAEEYFPAFGVRDNSPAAIYRRPPPIAFARKEWKWGRDGVPWPPGKEKLVWEKIEIEKRFIYGR